MIKNYAPILITVLNRYEHFKNCIESLERCKEAKFSDIYIALDYPPSEVYIEGYEKIKSYIKNKKFCFKSITIIEREKNYGALNNLTDAINQVFFDHETIIITEDDNIFSVDFLNFMNNALYIYSNNNKVFNVCGYMYPISENEFNHDIDVLAYDGFSAWGFGTWKKKFRNFSFDLKILNEFLENKNNLNLVKNKKLLKNLFRMKNENRIIGDSYISFFQIKNDMFSVFPIVSRVQNHGHDGSGLNCFLDKKSQQKYGNQKIQLNFKKKLNMPILIEMDAITKQKIDKLLNPNKIGIILRNPKTLYLYLKKIIKNWGLK